MKVKEISGKVYFYFSSSEIETIEIVNDEESKFVLLDKYVDIAYSDYFYNNSRYTTDVPTLFRRILYPRMVHGIGHAARRYGIYIDIDYYHKLIDKLTERFISRHIEKISLVRYVEKDKEDDYFSEFSTFHNSVLPPKSRKNLSDIFRGLNCEVKNPYSILTEDYSSNDDSQSTDSSEPMEISDGESDVEVLSDVVPKFGIPIPVPDQMGYVTFPRDIILPKYLHLEPRVANLYSKTDLLDAHTNVKFGMLIEFDDSLEEFDDLVEHYSGLIDFGTSFETHRDLLLYLNFTYGTESDPYPFGWCISFLFPDRFKRFLLENLPPTVEPMQLIGLVDIFGLDSRPIFWSTNNDGLHHFSKEFCTVRGFSPVGFHSPSFVMAMIEIMYVHDHTERIVFASYPTEYGYRPSSYDKRRIAFLKVYSRYLKYVWDYNGERVLSYNIPVVTDAMLDIVTDYVNRYSFIL